MIRELRTTFVLFATLFALTGIGYPLLTLVIAQAAFPYEANGSLIKIDGTVIGSELIGQGHAADDTLWFHGRPSLAGDGYDAMQSGASNLAPSSSQLQELVQKRADDLRIRGMPYSAFEAPLPVDLVTASASGLDPDISIEAAHFQVARVAKVRGIPARILDKLITDIAALPKFDILGEPRVNVLKLNLALNNLEAKEP